MRLELNLPALERLIGGGTEIELHLRQQIVQEFAKKHLKEVAKQASFEVALKEVELLVNEAAKEAFDVENLATKHLWPTIGFRLRSMVNDIIYNNIQQAIDDALIDIIEDQKRYLSDKVKEEVEVAMNKEISKLVEEGIQKRLEAASNICRSQGK